MALIIFLKAVALGIVVSAPVGPVAAMAISRSLVFGKRLGFLTGFGVALADLVFVCVAALGVSQVIEFVSQHRTILQFMGGLVLVILGTHLSATAKRVALQKTAKRVKVSVAVLGSFVIGVSNPLTVFTFLAAFAEPRFSHLDSTENIFLTILGVFVGACLWWLLLVFFVTRFRNKVQGKTLFYINRTLGVLIAVIGILMVSSRFFPRGVGQ